MGRMFELIHEMKFLPPGRGLWAMGTPITEERGLYAALNNCAFVSTRDLAGDESRGVQSTEPFTFLMDAAMLGVGVGFDTEGAGFTLPLAVSAVNGVDAGTFVVPDSREGW